MSRAARLLDRARAAGITVATAESCTAGLIAGAITTPAGASAIFDRAFVTYSNAAKVEMLDVSPDTLADQGAVSEAVARQMAEGARARAGVSLAIAVTGIAGPGGSEHKPEGRVCFALAGPSGVSSETVEYGAIGRDAVRAATVEHALDLLIRAVPGGPA